MLETTFLKNVRPFLIFLLFISVLVLLQLEYDGLFLAWGGLVVFLLFVSRSSFRRLLSTVLMFGIGYFLYLFLAQYAGELVDSKEVRVILNRLFLLVLVFFLFSSSMINRLPLLKYGWRTEWQETIYFPFLLRGKIQNKIWVFMLICVSVNWVSFAPFLLKVDKEWFQHFWLFALAFSLVNSLMEELIWRGGLFTQFSEQLGTPWAIVLTSLGFGLQHYSLGFSWGSCLLFALAGYFYAGLMIRSKSIVPAILVHFVINMLMVFSGFIF